MAGFEIKKVLLSVRRKFPLFAKEVLKLERREQMGNFADKKYCTSMEELAII